MLLRLIACCVLLFLALPASAEVIEVDGHKRGYILRGAPGGGPKPLLMVLHGGGGRAGQLEAHIGLTAPALEAGYLVAYPQGYHSHWNDGRLDVQSDAARLNIDDVAFLAAIIDRLVAKGQADPARVFVAGLSNGALMSLRFACDAAERVAGIVTVVGSLGIETAATCAPSRPVPLLMLNGTDDPLVPYAGGAVVLLSDRHGAVIGAEETLAIFAAVNGCGAVTVEPLEDPAPDDGIALEERAYRDCAAPARLLRYVGGGHGWPGAGQYLHYRLIGVVPEAPAANELLLDFVGRLGG